MPVYLGAHRAAKAHLSLVPRQPAFLRLEGLLSALGQRRWGTSASLKNDEKDSAQHPLLALCSHSGTLAPRLPLLSAAMLVRGGTEMSGSVPIA